MENQISEAEIKKINFLRNFPFLGVASLIFLCPFLALKIWPNFKIWEQKKMEIPALETQISQLEKTQKKLKKELENAETKFDFESKIFRGEEEQIFPKKIDPIKISQIFELYALSAENLDSGFHDSKFDLRSLNVGGTAGGRTKINIHFLADEKNFREFIQYLQHGRISQRFYDGQKNGQIDPIVFHFLENNLLPISQINSMNFFEIKEKEIPTGVLSIKINFDLFSQPHDVKIKK